MYIYTTPLTSTQQPLRLRGPMRPRGFDFCHHVIVDIVRSSKNNLCKAHFSNMSFVERCPSDGT